MDTLLPTTPADTARAESKPRRSRRSVLLGSFLCLSSIVVGVLLARKLTGSSWPLQGADTSLVVFAALCYLASFFFRALGWHTLFAGPERPNRGGCIASVGAAHASGIVLPFRLDYLVKAASLRKLGGRRKVPIEALAASIISLGLVDATAMLPLSISAVVTTSHSFRWPLVAVVFGGFGAALLLLAGKQILSHPLLAGRSRLARLAARAASHTVSARTAAHAWLYLSGCWGIRLLGSTLLLASLGVGYSPELILAMMCLSAAAAVLPITSGGAVANAGAAAAVLLVLGVPKEGAINFALASGMLLALAALASGLLGASWSVGQSARSRRTLQAAGSVESEVALVSEVVLPAEELALRPVLVSRAA